MSDAAKRPSPDNFLPLEDLLQAFAEGPESPRRETDGIIVVVAGINPAALLASLDHRHPSIDLLELANLVGHDLEIFEGARDCILIEASITPMRDLIDAFDHIDTRMLLREPRRLPDERHWVSRKQAPASQRREARKAFPQPPRRAKR